MSNEITPSTFSNKDKYNTSPNGKYKIIYENLQEIAMGGPLSSRCTFDIEEENYSIPYNFGGPPIWNEKGTALALPMWTVDRQVKLVIVDCERKHYIIYEKNFTANHITKFEDTIVEFTHSEFHNFKIETVDVSKEKIELQNSLMIDKYGILQLIIDVKFEDNAYSGKVDLPCWKDYTLEDATPHNGIIEIRIGQAYAETPHVISTADVNGVATALGKTENHQKQILEKLLQEYPKWKPDYGYSEEDAKHFMPDVTSTEEFKKLIMLANVHILPVEFDGQAYNGYEFNCQWDVEHGMGAMFHGDRLIELGMAESSFMLWIAQADKENHTSKQTNEVDLIFDKTAIQQALYKCTVEGFNNRAKEKPDATAIYALAYDFDLLYNVVDLSMNTIADNLATLEKYKAVSYMQENLNSETGLYEIKFHPGHYSHCAFETFKPLTAEQQAQMDKWLAEDTFESKLKWQINNDALMEALSEILAIYSKGEEVKLLPVIDGFYVCAIQHDEALTSAEKRIKKYL
jgi:hypothetical protein